MRLVTIKIKAKISRIVSKIPLYVLNKTKKIKKAASISLMT